MIGSLCALALLAAPASSSAAGPYELNDSYLSAFGPLTAGVTYSGALETSNDVDYFYFYVPQLTQLQFKLTNTSSKSTYVCSEIEHQYLDHISDVDDTSLAVRNGESKSGAVTLEPGKYYFVVSCPGAIGETYSFSIGPPGVTSTYEPFAIACAAAQPAVTQAAASLNIARSKFKAAKNRLAGARRWKAKRKRRLRRKIALLKVALGEAKAAYDAAAANAAAACSVPQ